MKKLLFPILVSTMLIIFFGCKSDTPVQANEDPGSVISLQKSANFSAVKSGNIVICTWKSYGGAKYYTISYSWSSYSATYAIVPITHGLKDYQVNINVSGFTAGTYTFYLRAYNGKDQTIAYYGSSPISIP